MRKEIYLFIIIIISILAVGLNVFKNNTKDKAENVKFTKILSSFYEGQIDLSLSFKCNKNRLDSWRKKNIEYAKLEIGAESFDVNIADVNIYDAELEDNKYRGSMSISGEFEQSSGQAYLVIKKKNKDRCEKYNVGKIAIIKNGNDEFQDCYFEMGGVVKTDEKDNVFNYGIVINLEAYKKINIKSVSMGLEDEVRVTKDYSIYDEKEYKTNIYDLINNTSLDKKIKNIYTKKKFELNTKLEHFSIDINKGKKYLIFPLKYRYGEEESLNEAVIMIKYVVDGKIKEKVVSNSGVFYIDMNRN
ncbi:MAG: hypothetical protein UCH84_03860 [Eubacterium sp.]|nr:hypothetical protein [Eubacterium sp.]